jgi:EmrB/QacA subfamily drug resistance transporter
MSLTPSEIRLIVIGAMLALFLSALDQTVVATALPPIARDLGNFALISWVITSYLLTSTCVTPIVGKLSDLYGRRKMLNGCLILFMAGSALCAMAPNMILLILFRALQGIGGGGLITMGQTIIADVVSPRERGRYAGYFAMVWGSASVLGPTVGGFVTQFYGWPWIFWINLPLGLAALLISDRALRKLNVDRHESRIDYAGVSLLCATTVSLLLVLSLGGKRLPWDSLGMTAMIVLTLALGAFFVLQQLQSGEPIMPPHFMRDRVIRPVVITIIVVYGAYLALAVLAPIYFQIALGRQVGEAGLLMIPFMLSSTTTANLAGLYTRRSGRYKRPPIVGLPIAIAAIAVLAIFATQLSATAAACVLMVAGIGLGPIFPCTTVAAQNAVERRHLGIVSGAVAFARALGGALGVAVGSALVLGLAAQALAQIGSVASLEDLAQHSLPPDVRHAVAHAFGYMFGAVALALALGLGIFLRVEDRELGTRAPAVTTPVAD